MYVASGLAVLKDCICTEDVMDNSETGRGYNLILQLDISYPNLCEKNGYGPTPLCITWAYINETSCN